MASQVPSQSASSRLAPAVVALAVALGAAGCSSLQAPAPTAVGALAAPATPADPRQASELWGERYRANPRDPTAAINYAQALRALGQRAQAVAVLEQAAIYNGTNMAVLGAYGRALAEAGNHQQALEVLNRAHTPDRPDWRILNAQGAVLDQLGRHQDAQRYYETALKIVPEQPAVLSNLGLSYALSRDLPQAEATLKRAAAGRDPDPRVRQNLALVIGLQGRFAEAEAIARADLPPEQAAANVAYLRHMLAQPNALAAARAPQQRSAPTRPPS